MTTESYAPMNFLIKNGTHMMHGRGMYFDKITKELFEGWFKDDKLIEGRCIQEDKYYEGFFRTLENYKFIKDGEGTEYLSDGTRYDGSWSNDEKHGPGIKYFANEL